MKYSKTIEAIQFLDTTEQIEQISNFVGEDFHVTVSYANPKKPTICVPYTSNLGKDASVGDYIIRDVNGMYSVCKRDIFEKTYEVAE